MRVKMILASLLFLALANSGTNAQNVVVVNVNIHQARDMGYFTKMPREKVSLKFEFTRLANLPDLLDDILEAIVREGVDRVNKNLYEPDFQRTSIPGDHQVNTKTHTCPIQERYNNKLVYNQMKEDLDTMCPVTSIPGLGPDDNANALMTMPENFEHAFTITSFRKDVSKDFMEQEKFSYFNRFQLTKNIFMDDIFYLKQHCLTSTIRCIEYASLHTCRNPDFYWNRKFEACPTIEDIEMKEDQEIKEFNGLHNYQNPDFYWNPKFETCPAINVTEMKEDQEIKEFNGLHNCQNPDFYWNPKFETCPSIIVTDNVLNKFQLVQWRGKMRSDDQHIRGKFSQVRRANKPSISMMPDHLGDHPDVGYNSTEGTIKDKAGKCHPVNGQWKFDYFTSRILIFGSCIAVALTFLGMRYTRNRQEHTEQEITKKKAWRLDGVIIADKSMLMRAISMKQNFAATQNNFTLCIMREINAIRSQCSNVCAIIGYSIMAPNVSVITIIKDMQFRGSLEDLFGNDDSKLPLNPNKFGRIKRLLAGLKFISDSYMKCHGRLKTSNCLVDNRRTSPELPTSDEPQRTDENQVSRLLPKQAPQPLKKGCIVEPEMFEFTTIYISDVAGFTTVARVSMLTNMCTLFDGITGTDLHDDEICSTALESDMPETEAEKDLPRSSNRASLHCNPDEDLTRPLDKPISESPSERRQINYIEPQPSEARFEVEALVKDVEEVGENNEEVKINVIENNDALKQKLPKQKGRWMAPKRRKRRRRTNRGADW